MDDRKLTEITQRIQEGLEIAAGILKPYLGVKVKAEYKSGDDPVTEADRAVNLALQHALLRQEEGWLSEESADDPARLSKGHVWIVDPLDGTREFVAGIPEWCVSIAWVEAGVAMAGGILNPATGESFIGAAGAGVLYNGQPARASARDSLDGAVILASRSEVKRGEWARFENRDFCIRPMGSVAYKLARVAAGLADATWTLTPKHEWDVAAGVALAEAGGALTKVLEDHPLRFNNKVPFLPGLIACAPDLGPAVLALLKSSMAAR